MENLNSFLDKKGREYKNSITFDVVKKAYDVISKFIKLPYIIHLVGTNGKGSTGRIIASILHQNNQKVLHFSSPHIIKISERFWLNGDDCDNEILNQAHKNILDILKNIANELSYFEYLTILALYLSKNVDYLVLEAGLGGEFDATNVVVKDLSVIPTIGLDHIEILGNNIYDIAKTKLKSINKAYIFGKNLPKEVLLVEKEILRDKKKINLIELELPKNDYALFLQDNLLLALNVIKYLKFDYKNIVLPKLKGKMERYGNVILDVGHNQLAALAIKKELKNNKINLIYNTYKDKNYKKIISILKDNIKKIYILPIDDDRIIDSEILINYIKSIGLEVDIFDKKIINKNETYLVFGSFKVVERFFEK